MILPEALPPHFRDVIQESLGHEVATYGLDMSRNRIVVDASLSFAAPNLQVMSKESAIYAREVAR